MKLKSNHTANLTLMDGRTLPAGSTTAIDDATWATWQHNDVMKAWLRGNHVEIVDEPRLTDDGTLKRKQRVEAQEAAAPPRDAAVEPPESVIEAPVPQASDIAAQPGPFEATRDDNPTPRTKRGRPRGAGKASRK